MRRKGEKRIIHPPFVWSDDSTLARDIREGTGWLDAWMQLQSVGIDGVAKRSKLPRARVVELLFSTEVAEGELEGLAVAFRTDAQSIKRSIGCRASMGKGRC